MQITKEEVLICEVSIPTYEWLGGMEMMWGTLGSVIEARLLYAHCKTRIENSDEFPNIVDAEVLDIYLALHEYQTSEGPVIVKWVNSPQRGEKR